jgi:hypothetical protein
MWLPEADLVELFTGLVVESLAVTQDFGAGTVGCRSCGADLGAGDAVTVALTCYGDYSWEISAIACRDHGAGDVAATMGVRAENQAVVGAVLAAGRYEPPRGGTESEALVLADVEVLDYSPTADGY